MVSQSCINGSWIYGVSIITLHLELPNWTVDLRHDSDEYIDIKL